MTIKTSELNSFFPENLYHSYVIEGEIAALVPSVRTLLEQRGDISLQSPDIFSNTYDAFTIADSSIIKEWHNSRALTSDKKICIIGAQFINHEAQQSLLKILEEPQENTHFFLVVPTGTNLLDTIRSRTHTIKIGIDSLPVVSGGYSKKFMTVPLQKRLDLIAQIIEQHKDTEGSGSLRYEATQLVNDIEKEIHEKFHKDPAGVQMQFILDELKNAREYLSVPGCSVKMILEHIALVI
jgi:hypothetical protein